MSRRWMLARAAGAVVAVLASAVAVVRAQHEARMLFVELERLNDARDELDIEWGQLQLEQSAWSNARASSSRSPATRGRMMVCRDPDDVRIVAP